MDSRRRTYGLLIGLILLTLPCYCAGIIALVMAPDDQATIDVPPTLPFVVSPTPSNTSVPGLPPDQITAVPTITPFATGTEGPPLPATPPQFQTPILPTQVPATATATTTIEPTITPTATATGTVTAVASPTATQTAVPTQPATATPTLMATALPTTAPTATENALPTATPTATATPTDEPVSLPTSTPTSTPTG